MTNKFWNHYRSFNEACKKYKMNGGGISTTYTFVINME